MFRNSIIPSIWIKNLNHFATFSCLKFLDHSFKLFYFIFCFKKLLVGFPVAYSRISIFLWIIWNTFSSSICRDNFTHFLQLSLTLCIGLTLNFRKQISRLRSLISHIAFNWQPIARVDLYYCIRILNFFNLFNYMRIQYFYFGFQLVLFFKFYK